MTVNVPLWSVFALALALAFSLGFASGKRIGFDMAWKVDKDRIIMATIITEMLESIERSKVDAAAMLDGDES